jgi:hypothetical protein
MTLPAPVVFIHNGYSWYLPYALYQAKSTNCGTKVVLLGDGAFRGIETAPLAANWIPEIDGFRAVYLHMSTHGVEFELFCWLRWFYLLGYMRKNNLDAVWYFDSDVLVYGDLGKAQEYVGANGCGFSIPDSNYGDGAASGHASYWTRLSLDLFCRFCIECYQRPDYLRQYNDKWAGHQARQAPGGVCDMTTLFMFWVRYPEIVFNLSKVSCGRVFDHNMNIAANVTADEYQLDGAVKKIIWADSCRPQLVLAGGCQSLILAEALHFQGGAKKLIPKCYTGIRFRWLNLFNAYFWCAPLILKLKKLTQ